MYNSFYNSYVHALTRNIEIRKLDSKLNFISESRNQKRNWEPENSKILGSFFIIIILII